MTTENKEADIFDDIIEDAKGKKEKEEDDGVGGEEKREDDSSKVTEEGLQEIRDHLNSLAIKMQAESGSTKKATFDEIKLELPELDFGEIDEDTGITAEQMQKALKSVQENTAAAIIKTIDNRFGTMQEQTQSAVTGLLMAERFFNNNPDLEPYRAYVGVKWDRIVAENKNISFSELFERLNKEVRQDLKLGKRGSGGNGNPALPKDVKSTERPGDDDKKKSIEQKSLDELYPGRR